MTKRWAKQRRISPVSDRGEAPFSPTALSAGVLEGDKDSRSADCCCRLSRLAPQLEQEVRWPLALCPETRHEVNGAGVLLHISCSPVQMYEQGSHEILRILVFRHRRPPLKLRFYLHRCFTVTPMRLAFRKRGRSREFVSG